MYNHDVTILAETMLDFSGRVYLTVSADETGYHFYYGSNEQMKVPLYLKADPTLLSSVTNSGFTGTYLGMYGTSNKHKTEGYATSTGYFMRDKIFKNVYYKITNFK